MAATLSHQTLYIGGFNMKKVLSFLKIIVKSTLLLICVFFIYNILNYMFLNKEVFRNESFHSLPKDTLDIVVLGSSNAQYSYVPEYTWLDDGLYSYVLGSACQPIKVSYQMLKEALKTQSPKLVILEVYTTMPISSVCGDDSCYVLAGYQMRGEEREETFNYLDSSKAEEYNNEFINNHNNWRNITSLEELKPLDENKVDTSSIDTSFGFLINWMERDYTNKWFPNVYDEDLDVQLDSEDLEAFNNILTLCKENDMELLLYKTPIDSISQEDQSYLHQVWKWADENDVEYIDFIKLAPELGLYINEYTDSIHAYMNGAGVMTNYINNFIKENYSFNHTDNELLDSIMSSVSYTFTDIYLNQEYNQLYYATRVKNYDKLKAISIKDINSNSVFYNQFISNLGLENINNGNNLNALVYGDTVLMSSNDSFEYDYDGNRFVFNENGIFLNDIQISIRDDYNIIIFNDVNTYTIGK